MRITGGEYRGRTVYSGKTRNIRPATDRVRETIFAILPQYIDLYKTKVIDLYAGTGSLGFECLSRGAKFVVFVDASRDAVKIMKRTADELNCTNRCEIVLNTVERYIKNPSHRGGLIFADPPYALEGLSDLPAMIARAGIAEREAVLLIEHSKQTVFRDDNAFTIFRQKVFGNSIVSFFRLHNSESNDRIV